MKRKKNKKALKIVAIALSLGLFAAALGVLFAGRMGGAAEVFATISAPVQQAGDFLKTNAAHIYGEALEYDALLQENAALRAELSELKTHQREANAALQENERLRELLNLRKVRNDLTLETARVLSVLQSNWGRSIILDKGLAEEVAAGDCVIDSCGALVGRVSEVGAKRATVQLISDAAFELGGECADSLATGVLEGEISLMAQGKLRLTCLEKDCGVAVGEEVVSFASQGVYPHGLLVGTVEEITLDASGLSRTATVRPAAALDDLYQVFIITDFTAEN